MGRCKNQKTRPRQPAPRTNRPSPTWVPPIPHSVFLSLPPESSILLLSWGGGGGRYREFLCFGTFWLWRRRNSNPSRPRFVPLLYYLKENLTSEDCFFLGLSCVSFLLSILFLPENLMKNRLLVLNSELSVLYIYRVVVVGRNAVYIVGLSITACFQVKQYR